MDSCIARLFPLLASARGLVYDRQTCIGISAGCHFSIVFCAGEKLQSAYSFGLNNARQLGLPWGVYKENPEVHDGHMAEHVPFPCEIATLEKLDCICCNV